MATNKGIEYILDEIKSGNVDALYKDIVWVIKRDCVLNRDNYECQRCLGKFGKRKRIKLTKANTVHHKVEIRDAPELMLEDSNLISLCRACHDEIHDRIPKKFNKKKETKINEMW